LEKRRFTAFFSLIWSSLFFFSSLSYLYPSKEKKEDRLNVLLITIDTLRADRLSCYGSEHLQTPNIDRLAKMGILFSRAFANTSTTLPSHSNILLGTTPLYHGVHDNLNFIVSEDHLTLAEHLKSHGYSTGSFVGSYSLDSRFGLSQGFDLYDDNYDRSYSKSFPALERKGEVVVDNALNRIEFLREPWFIWIHLWDPHTPYEPPEPFKTRYNKNPYDGEVAYVDFVLGRLFDYLNEKNLFERTLLIFTGDHGESLGQHEELTHAFFAYNTTIWVPLIFCIPGINQGQIDQNVSHLDIFPTVCDFLGIDKPSFLQGDSLYPVLKGKQLPRRLIYFESLYPYYSRGWAPLWGFIDEGEKFIESPIPELYDLEKDFDESNNLSEDKRLDGYRKELAQLMETLSNPKNEQSRKNIDREALERLRSLGYISSSWGPKKENFGPEDDVKVLIPFHNRTYEAKVLYEEGKTKEGKELLESVISERKDMDMAYQQLAGIHKNEGNIKKALEVLNLGLENIPSSYYIYSNYIRFLISARMYDEVISVFNEKSFPEIDIDPEIWNNLGIAYLKKDSFDKAIEALERALTLDSKYAAAFYNLGEAYFFLAGRNKDRDLLKRSLDSYKKSIEIDPNYPAPYYGLGQVYRLIGNLEGAILCWTKALELQPDFDRVIFLLGLAYMDKSDKVKALGYFNTLKETFFHTYPESQRKKIEALIQECMK
jgi:arylsulfatase A-like enzyme/Tfp pilus assembly protein PilF